MISTRIGVLSSLNNEEFFKDALNDYSCEIITNFERSLTEQFEYWITTNTLICIIDDELLKDKPDVEDIILEYFSEVHYPALRLILFSDQVREKEDTFFYQLVSNLDIKDIIFTDLIADAKSTLINKIEHPTLLAEVSHWKTTDKKKLVRKKPGLISKLKPKKTTKPKEKKGRKSKKDDTSALEPESIELQSEKDESEDLDIVEKTEVMPKVTIENSTEKEISEESNPDEEEYDYFAQVIKEYDKTKEEIESPIEKEEVVIAHIEANEKNIQSVDKDETIPEISIRPNKIVSPAFTLNDLLGAIERSEIIPKAKTTIAVGAIRHGIGCTHLSVAIGSALASKELSVAVAINERNTFTKMKEALTDSQNIEAGFKWHECDFYYWSDEYKYAEKYDYVVCDCGVIDFTDSGKNTPTYRFKTADIKPYIISGAPWDLQNVLDIMQNYPITELETWTMCFYSMEQNTINAITSGLNTLLNSESEATCFSIPFRGQLFSVSEDKDFIRYYPLIKDSLSEELKQESEKILGESKDRIRKTAKA